MLLVDASAVVDVITDSPNSAAVLDRIRGQDLIAPEIVDVEVCSAMARLERANLVTSAETDRALALYRELPLHRVAHYDLMNFAWQLRHSVRVADAFYVACALAVDAPILTLDQRMIRSAPQGVRFVSFE
ncbi:type II toxin-antitoxin system VapC family toxin [Rathayibacter soli]|uniref:type II toxin-antitoxin system VapC family toxin n=1 Tax=Rathayibacter soli TaxID=3144168 RepID=UPI0027E4BEDF|nr:type II toxin-antitoxin system VapC family toxin [Glaciibacter superstes]